MSKNAKKSIGEKQIERPLKDKLLPQEPKRGVFAIEDPHSHTSNFWVCSKKSEGDFEMKEPQERRGPGRYTK
jgi:hypothetical protein